MAANDFYQTDATNPHLGGNLRDGDPNTYAPSVWDYMIDRFAVSSVLDLGAGMGYSSHYFFKKGMKVISVEGMKDNVENAVYPSILHDLTESPVNCKVDLVHCQEVVEHIEEKFVDNLLRSLACGRFILMTHAVPGQDGHHHVNCQPTEYWVEKLARYNYRLLVIDSNRVRALAGKDSAIFLAATGLVFARGQ